MRIEDGAGIHVPRVVGVRATDIYHGDDWIGLKTREASVVRGIGVFPVFAGLIGLLLLVGSLATTWAREGRCGAPPTAGPIAAAAGGKPAVGCRTNSGITSPNCGGRRA